MNDLVNVKNLGILVILLIIALIISLFTRPNPTPDKTEFDDLVISPVIARSYDFLVPPSCKVQCFGCINVVDCIRKCRTNPSDACVNQLPDYKYFEARYGVPGGSKQRNASSNCTNQSCTNNNCCEPDLLFYTGDKFVCLMEVKTEAGTMTIQAFKKTELSGENINKFLANGDIQTFRDEYAKDYVTLIPFGDHLYSLRYEELNIPEDGDFFLFLKDI